MQIKQISLYGKNGGRRDLEFEIGKVNIITGASKKGKTSLIHIIEYCLGASECMVAEGHIKETVAWYSVLLQFPDCQVFIARAAPLPGNKANTSSFMLVENEVSVPQSKSDLKSSTNIDTVVSYLTTKVGVPENKTEVPDNQTRHEVNVGFRHSRYYLFQGQTEIANNEILFHQQAKPHIPQNIKDTLPYFIGAAEDDRLSDLQKLRELKREKAILVKELREVESLKGEGLQKGYVLLTQAQNLGLTSYENTSVSDSELLKQLEEISKWIPAIDEDVADSDTLVSLERKLRSLINHRNVLKFKRREIEEYSDSESGYVDALEGQSQRLQSIGAFSALERISGECPLCESEMQEENKFESVIRTSLNRIDEKLTGVGRTHQRVTGFLNEVVEQQKDNNLEIKKIRSAIAEIRNADEAAANDAELDIIKAKLVGKISLYLESVDWSQDTSGLENEIKSKDAQLEALNAKLDPEALKDRLSAQLDCIAEDMTAWAKELGLGYSENSRIKLDADKLTVVANTPDGAVPLSKMGSGENWVGYHLVTYLALAKWFIKRNRPVGRFVFFDQPTQAFYPADNLGDGKLDEISDDEDRKSVLNIYRLIFSVVEELSSGLQVIVTDHADIDEPWFQDAIVDKKWRGENALIPLEWYSLADVTEEQFHEYLNSIIEICKQELNYNPTYLIRMIDERGVISAVSDLVSDQKPSEGLVKLAAEGRLDLSLESIILEDPWNSLFHKDVLDAARRKLS